MPYCANKFWSLNLKRFKPSFFNITFSMSLREDKFVKIKQDSLLKFGVFFSELYVCRIVFVVFCKESRLWTHKKKIDNQQSS